MNRLIRSLLFVAILLIGANHASAFVIGAATSTNPPTCQGATDGWVTIDSLITTPPTGPYVIRINTTPVQFFSVGDTVFGLTTQNYIITILDLADNSVAFSPVNFASSGINAAAFSFPASCFGVCDGSASVAVIGGNPPYTYSWDDPSNQSTQVASALCAGTFRVTVSDANSCSVVDSVVVGQPPQILPNVVVTDVSCFGFSDGSATSTPSGGTGTYVNYQWSSSGNNTSTEGGLTAGTYTVTVTDSDGCTDTETFVVGQPADLNVSFAVTNVDCFGDSTGIINTTVNGGTTPYNFNWSDGGSTQSRTNISEGTYTVTITDNNGCVLVDSATVTENLDIVVNLTVAANNACFGDANGIITGSFSGGTAPFSFNWSQGTNGNGGITSINNLTAGTYTITVTDNLGCTELDSATVTEPSQIQIAVDNVDDPACNGDTNGLINLTTSGGTPALTFDWNNSDNTEDISGLSAGTYTLTVTDANGCTATFDTTLTDPALLTFVFDSISNVSCNGGNDGFARVVASGGTGAYTYNWSNTGNTASIGSLTAGTYTLTLTDANGCTAVDSTSIIEPDPIVVTVNSTDVSCFGNSDGDASANPSGGTSPYTYLWAPNGQTTQNITNITAGTYTVTVTDNNGCTGTGTTVVNQPPSLTVNITSNNPLCNGDNNGLALANVLGGNPAYTFQWDDPANQTANPATGLTAGTYRLTVTDNNGCTIVDSVTLTQPAVLNASITTYDVSCGAVNDGAAAAMVTGGTLPYTYNWGPGNPIGQGTDSISSLTTGSYSLTVTDNNSCSTTLNFNINQQPPVFSLSDSSVDPLCNGGSDGFIGIQISGGTAPFTYNWIPALSNSGNQPNLSANTYNVTVTDNSGCSNTTSVTLTDPAGLVINDTITDESCSPGNDGTITLFVNGGTPSYNYTWIPALSNSPNQPGLSAGNYSVTVTDNNGCTATASYTVNALGAAFTVSLVPIDVSCNGLSDGNILANTNPPGSFYRYNWSDIGVGPSLRVSLSAGTYSVTVTDTITGCFVIDSVAVNEPPVIQSNLNITPDGCSGTGAGSVTSNPSGGNGSPYTFNWNTPGGSISGNTVTNLSAGTYTVTITDNSSCTLVDTFQVGTVTSNIDPNEIITDASCNGICDGAITLGPANGVSPYFFNWSDGPSVSQNRSNLCAGTYTVTITGSDNCDTILSLVVGEPAAISSTINTTPDTCVTGVGGARATGTSNGTPPYTYSWPAGGIASGDSVRNLNSGNYDLTITDNNGCESILPFTIGNDASFSVNLNSTDVSCSNGSDGTITVNVIGGTAPVTYDWSGGLSGANPSNISGGTYTITVTDANGCGAVQSILVNQPGRLSVDNLITYDENCIPGNDGAARIFFSGGTPPYIYTWPASGTAVGDSVNSLSAGNYDLTISDVNGCDTIVNFDIGSAASFAVNVAITDASCNGIADGALNVTVSGASAPLTFNWSDIGIGTANRSNLAAGNYGLTVTDGSGCSETSVSQIQENNAVSIDNIVTTDETCSPGGDGTATSSVSGGTTPYTYGWSSTAATTPGITGLSAGIYRLTVTDNNGCTAQASFRIGTGSNIISNDSTRDASCFGACDGQIILNPSGGVAPYTYNWSPIGGSTNTLSNLCAGGYRVTISDNVGCTTIDDFVIDEPNDLGGFFNRTTESCNPGNDGTARITVVGGTTPYTYNWGSGNVPTNNNGGYAAGSYDVTVTDNNGCSKVFPFNIDPSPAITVSATSTPATCGNNDGTINVSVANSTNPLTYDWSDVTIGGADPINVAAGTYTVTVTDGNGCTDTEVITITTNGNYPLNETITDASCNGDCDGGVTLSPSGGIAPYTYLWGNNSTDFFRAGLCAGTYDVTVTDNTGCSTTGNFTIGEPAILATILSPTDESCSPGGDGSVAAAVSGGTAPYTYQWTPGGATSSSISNLSSGTYTVTITDSKGCTVEDSASVGSGGNLDLNPVLNDASCNGNCDGDITLSPSGGNAPYTFLWDDNSSNAGRSALCAGPYDVTVTDNSGCSTIQSFTINEPAVLAANASSTDESCSPGNDGTTSTAASGGTPPYTYNWTGGGTSSGLINLTAGTYTVTLTDSNGCTAIETVNVNTGGGLSLGETVIPPSCFNDCDGSITLSPSGGVPPYTYLWDNNSNTFFRTSLCDGSYDVTVTDNFGCSRVETFNVSQPDSLQANLSATAESCVPGGDGTASSNAIGGTAPYTYLWSPGSATTSGLSSLTAGTYTVTITDDNGCSVIDSVVVNGGGNILFNETITDASCNGVCDGNITLSPSGGTAPYTYLWDDNSTDFFRSSLCAGSYNVTVSDNTGCSRVGNFIVGEPNTIQANLSTDDESCSPGGDGSASTAASGGTSPYTYNWSPGGATTSGISSLSTGTYFLTITDNNGCSVLDTAIINSGANINLNEVLNDVSCNGICDGDIALFPSGGIAPYTYSWNNSASTSSLSGLCAGIYDVTVTDNIGCSRVASFNINEPDSIVVNISSDDESCSPGGDGRAFTAVSGGTPPFTYAWSPGGAVTPNLSSLSSGVYIVTVTDDNGCTAVDSTTVSSGGNLVLNEVINDASCNTGCDGDISLSPSGGLAPYTFLWDNNTANSGRSGLCAGNYDVTVSDNTGCSTVQSLVVGEPAPITTIANINDESCNPGADGSINTTVSGGTPPYTYAWSAGGATTPGVSSLTAGSYTLTITDDNGCVSTQSFNLGVAASYTINAVVTDPSCPGSADGSIDQTVTGTFDTLVYTWSNGLPDTEDQFGLTPGTYKVTVSDIINACDDSVTYVINPSSSGIDPNLSLQNDGCSALTVCQGYAVSDPIGGSAPYTFNWAGPGTSVNGVDSIGSLCAGTYTLTLTDANGCDTIVNFNIGPRSIITTNASFTDETCAGFCDGTAAVNPTGGVNPYTFAWSNSAGNVNSIGGLCDGTYTVTITDAAQCDTTVTFNIGTNAINYTLNSNPQSCNGGCDGTAQVQIPGGNSGYNFNWSPNPGSGQGTAQVSGLCVGQYFLTISLNATGCFTLDTITIDPFSPILPNESSADESCSSTCDGIARVSPSEGIPPYTYIWTPAPPNNQQGNPEIRDLCAGVYSVQILDASNCDTTISITISAAGSITANIIGEDPICSNLSPCEGKAFVSPSGGSAPYSYQWSLGVTTGLTADTAINLCNGQYFVTITDNNGCTVKDSININGPAPIDTSFSALNSVCNLCDGSLKVFPIGGTAPYTFAWFDASLNPLSSTIDSIGDLCSGIYFVDITDSQGCSARFARSISDIGAEQISLSKTDVSCFGGSDGDATVNFNCTDPSCSIAWFDGSAQPLNVNSNTASNLSAGTYFVEVTNNSGCKRIVNITIDQPDQFVVGPTVSDASCSNSCDGSISVVVGGGTAPYSYSWSPAPASGQGTATANGLCSGAYDLRITDANGCDTVLSIAVGAPPPLTASFNRNDADCNQSNGSITANVSGGTVSLDYQYQWFDASNNPLGGQTSATINNLTAGSYLLRVTDDNNCAEDFIVALGSTNGPALTVDSIVDPSCFGDGEGEIYITASGGGLPYTYNWLNQGQTTEDIKNLNSGTYTVLVTNASGCVSTDTATISGPDQLLASIINTDATCGQCNGLASISVSGGTAPYSYLWDNGSTADTAAALCGGVHTVEVTDANGCISTFNFITNTVEGPSDAVVSATNESCTGAADGSATVDPIGGTAPYTYEWIHNGATSNSLSNLTSGTYFILITDAAGCSRNVEVVIGGPSDIEIQPIVTSSSCGITPCNGSILLSTTGGVSPYTYNWQSAPAADTNFLGGLCAGIYNVTVSDASGCSKVLSIPLSNDGNVIDPNPTFTNPSCYEICDGSLISNLSGGANLSYRWLSDQGVALSAINTDLLNVVCAGTYQLEVTSLPQGCISYTTVKVEEPDSIRLGASIVKNISCNGDCDGEIYISTLGGTLLFNYSWDDPNGQDGVPATNLCAGTYAVTATDANGCSATTSVTLLDPPPLNVSLNSSSVLGCSSDCDAEADVSANGGTQPYTFDWDGGQSGSNPNDLCFGPNILTVTDATGCTQQLTVNIAATDTVVAQVPADTLYCEGDSIQLNGTILGSTVTSFAWYLADTATIFTPSADTTIYRGIGSYTFFLIATNGGCSDTTIYQPRVVETPLVSVPSTINIYKDEVAKINVGGQSVDYLYNWNPATDLNDSTLAEPTSSTQENRTYVLTVSDTNGCTYVDSVRVIYNEDLDIPSGISPNGDGKNDVWRLDVLEEFPNAKVQIFNRWGELLYEQPNGYKEPWDGTYNGKALPIGTYYFVIDLKSDRFETITGPITIVK